MCGTVTLWERERGREGGTRAQTCGDVRAVPPLLRFSRKSMAAAALASSSDTPRSTKFFSTSWDAARVVASGGDTVLMPPLLLMPPPPPLPLLDITFAHGTKSSSMDRTTICRRSAMVTTIDHSG